MTSADVKANIKQQEVSYLTNFYKKYLQNLKYIVKGYVFFIWFWHTFQPIRCSKREVYNEPVSTWRGTMVATEVEILDFSTPKTPENAFCGIFTYLNLV